MQYKTILRLIGLLLILFSSTMLPPLAISGIYAENIWQPFLIPFVLILGSGSFLCFIYRKHRAVLRIREGFLIVVIIWLLISCVASLPFILYSDLQHTLTDAVFETVSGITTTGASCFTDIDTLPHAILYYRQQLQFIGGMGVVVLAVAIFPMLGMGGGQLLKLESSDPLQQNKLTPRIAQTAKNLWIIYCFMTITCAACYWYAGMDWFYAIGESFGTVSTGGLPMHDQSFLFYKSDSMELLAALFMFLGASSFSLHYTAFQQHSFKTYWHNEECRFYLKMIGGVLGLITLMLWSYHYFSDTPLRIIDSLFIVISMVTTTGYTLYPFDLWPTFVPVLLVVMSLIGGAAGSTSGGLKILRLMLITKQSKRELLRTLHPQAMITIKMDQQTVPEIIMQSATGFAVVYFGIYLFLLLLFMACGNDFLSSFSAIAAGLANSGAGIGSISTSFGGLSEASKWLLILTMIIGRLEIFPLLILFTRAFWPRE